MATKRHDKVDVQRNPNGFVARPLCPFCSAPWSDDMIYIEADASQGCDTCGYGGGTYGEVRINCHKCKRLIYLKEFDNRG